MKIPAKAVGLGYRNLYLFAVPENIEFPMGTRVTIKVKKKDLGGEPDFTYHQCERAAILDMKMSRILNGITGESDGKWQLWRSRPGGTLQEIDFISDVQYCPYCGMRLSI